MVVLAHNLAPFVTEYGAHPERAQDPIRNLDPVVALRRFASCGQRADVRFGEPAILFGRRE